MTSKARLNLGVNIALPWLSARQDFRAFGKGTGTISLNLSSLFLPGQPGPNPIAGISNHSAAAVTITALILAWLSENSTHALSAYLIRKEFGYSCPELMEK